MIKTYQPTSFMAYKTEIKPTLGERQKLVFKELKKHSHVTNTELSNSLGIPINTVTPRVNELRKLGYVREWGKRPCRVTGKMAIAWMSNLSILF